MNFSCEMADDLLPLYVDGSCSEDSRTALEEHLAGCPSCRAKLERMQKGIPERPMAEPSGLKLASYAKKVRRHQIRAAVSVFLVIVIASAVLTLVYLTLSDMHRQANPRIFQVEAGTCNLTAGDLEVTAEEAGKYVLFTNSTQIKVTVQGGSQGTVLLWDAADSDGFIQICEVNGGTASCTFTGLSASHRYRITCDRLDGATLTISEGRTVSFWHSLGTVLNEMIRVIGG